jgi:hypothetical protein
VLSWFWLDAAAIFLRRASLDVGTLHARREQDGWNITPWLTEVTMPTPRISIAARITPPTTPPKSNHRAIANGAA